MLSEEEIQQTLSQKEKERKYLQYDSTDIVEKMKKDYILTIEIALLKVILN